MLTAKTLRECQCFNLLNALCDLSLSVQNSLKVLAHLTCFFQGLFGNTLILLNLYKKRKRQMLPFETVYLYKDK